MDSVSMNIPRMFYNSKSILSRDNLRGNRSETDMDYVVRLCTTCTTYVSDHRRPFSLIRVLDAVSLYFTIFIFQKKKKKRTTTDAIRVINDISYISCESTEITRGKK